MGRKNLIWYPGAVYHIITRGNHKNNIFNDKEDYIVYLNKLKEVLCGNGAAAYCYCLMTNHIHLVLETRDIEISYIMKLINQYYVRYFNNKYSLIGHLFQGRYYWKLIGEDKYMLEVSRYIHLNPVRANIVEKPEEYRWSSYSMIIGEKKESLIDSYRILSYFQDIDNRLRYRRFVENGCGKI